MPNGLPVSLPTGLTLKKTRHLPAGLGDVSFDVAAQPGSDVLAAIAADPPAPFPRRRIEVEELSASVSAGRPVSFNSGKGSVTFNGKASGYERLAVLDDPSEVTALLVRDSINDDIARGLALPRSEGTRYVVLRWGYDLEGAAKGSVALGAGPSVTFGAEGKRLGAYAVIRQFPADAGARPALEAVFQSWMLPTQFRQLDDLEPGTWIVSEVDGSIALSLGAQYGFDFSWVRDAVQLGGASGDIGLKIQAGVSASVGFEASGQYAVALGRPLDARQVRLQLFRLDRKGLNLAFSASATTQGSAAGFPDNFDDFVKGVFGLHGLQVLKDLIAWTSPDRKLSDLLANVGDDYAQAWLERVTGADAKTQFDTARQRLLGLLKAWQALPHRTASVVYTLVEKQGSRLPALRAQLTELAGNDLTAFQPRLAALLSDVDFFRTPFGQWLESAALTSVLAAASDGHEFARVQEIASQTLAVLDGGALERTLVNLQNEVGHRIGLAALEHIVDDASFEAADQWLKARLSAFLGRAVDLPQVVQLRAAAQKLLALRETFFAKGRAALTKKYEFQLLASYQRATTSTALVDVVFDFDAATASPAVLHKLAVAAIGGDLEQLITTSTAGVVLRQAALTHGIRRQTHVEVTLPFMQADVTSINSSLARLESIQSEGDRILVYDLSADDLMTAKGKFSSHFAVHGRFTTGTTVRVFDDQSMTQSYVFRQAVPKMRRVALEAQLKAYVDTYFPQAFGSGEASLSTWISDLDRTVDKVLNNGPDNFGNTLLSLELTAPSTLVGAWAQAPAKEDAEPYFELSRAIQTQLRMLIPLCHFADLSRYKDRVPSSALLVYASLPPATAIAVRNGHVVRFDDRRDVYWNIEDPDELGAIASHALTQAALLVRLTKVHDILTHADGMSGIAADYDPKRFDRVLNNALHERVGVEDLHVLLRTERDIVREARQAGVAIAGFLSAANTERARRALATFGSKVTAAFNTHLGSLFSGSLLRPLGTMVFLEAGRAFAGQLQASRPSAMLELNVVRDAPSFDLGSFVDGTPVPEGDLVVPPQKFVAIV